MSQLQALKRDLFPKEMDNFDQGLCPFCDKPIDLTAFRDKLSLAEHNISGLCQVCQEKMFDAPEEGSRM